MYPKYLKIARKNATPIGISRCKKNYSNFTSPPKITSKYIIEPARRDLYIYNEKDTKKRMRAMQY